MRKCSRSCQIVWGAPLIFLPRNSGNKPRTASANPTCAPLKISTLSRCCCKGEFFIVVLTKVFHHGGTENTEKGGASLSVSPWRKRPVIAFVSPVADNQG